MFDNIEQLAKVAMDEVQQQFRLEALERGENYRPCIRPGITQRVVASTFWRARNLYQVDKSLSVFEPKPDDEETDKFKRMLTLVSYNMLYEVNGFEPIESDVRVMRHILGHIFGYRRHGKFDTNALETATTMKLVKGDQT